MLRSAVGRAVRAAKWVALFWGAVLTLAALFGAASVALAANGQPFLLGRAANAATALTGLAADVDGPAVRIANNGAGADDTALSLAVQAGEAPMRVNSGAKVANLNAERVDGLSSEELRGRQGPPGEQGLPGEPRYTRTVVVGPQDGATSQQNGAALLEALDGITGATAENPYLLYLEPGTYDLGDDNSLTMEPWVDVEGSGELNTVITSGTSRPICNIADFATVNGADNAEMRFLTVRNTGGRLCSTAISNVSASPRLTHVTAEATGGLRRNVAVLNSIDANPTMTDVTATVSADGTENVAVDNLDSRPTIKQSTLSGSTAALTQDGRSATVALTQLEGPVRVLNNGRVQCFNNYDRNVAAVTCP